MDLLEDDAVESEEKIEKTIDKCHIQRFRSLSVILRCH